MHEPNIGLLNMDCLLYMKQCEDKQFDWAIVDPPYGIGFDGHHTITKEGHKGFSAKKELHAKKDWDSQRPSAEYFAELQRISKNQIVWGGNYFTDLLEPARCYIVWDKKTGDNSYADCELALTNIDGNARIYTKFWLGAHAKDGYDRIHPTQKPINLYKFLLQNFAKAGMKIIDTHLGSGSISIACYDEGYDLVGIEIDKKYFEEANKRLELYKQQLTLF